MPLSNDNLHISYAEKIDRCRVDCKTLKKTALRKKYPLEAIAHRNMLRAAKPHVMPGFGSSPTSSLRSVQNHFPKPPSIASTTPTPSMHRVRFGGRTLIHRATIEAPPACSMIPMATSTPWPNLQNVRVFPQMLSTSACAGAGAMPRSSHPIDHRLSPTRSPAQPRP